MRSRSQNDNFRNFRQHKKGGFVKTGTVTQYLFCQELNKTERLRYTRKHRNGVPVGTHFLLDKGTPLNPFGENRSDELTGEQQQRTKSEPKKTHKKTRAIRRKEKKLKQLSGALTMHHNSQQGSRR